MENEFELQDMAKNDDSQVDMQRDTEMIENKDVVNPDDSKLTIGDITGFNLLRSVTGNVVDATVGVGSGIATGIVTGIGKGTTMVVDGTTTVMGGTANMIGGAVNGAVDMTTKTGGVIKNVTTSVMDTTVNVMTYPIRMFEPDDPNYHDLGIYEDYFDFDDSPYDDYAEARLLTDSEIEGLSHSYRVKKKADPTGTEEILFSDSDDDNDQ